jgi:hypothetical protein
VSAPYEANLAALASRFPDLAALVDASEGLPLEALSTPKGLPSARLAGVYLHSAYDPEGEARRIAATLPPLADSVVLLGLGLGYLAEALLGRSPGGRELVDRLFVCEASPSFLKACFALRDMSALLADERLGFVVGGSPDTVLGALDASSSRRPTLLGIKACELAFPEWYGALREAVGRYTAKEGINENTLHRFGPRWVRNLTRNLPLLASLPGTSRLEGRFSGLPALVLAAGPSLDEVLPRIGELRERALIVCVDTALRSLLGRGVEPDILVVVDPQYWNWRHLEGLRAPRSILVSESAAWPAVFRFECRAAFLCSSLFPLGRFLETSVGVKGELGAGGSVATSSWDLCRLLGSSPIYMGGLDLSFPAGGTHARASLFEQRALAAGGRLSPSSGLEAASLFSAPSRRAPANDGSVAHSDERLSLYAWWFESRLAREGSPLTLNLSPRGLAIPGMPLSSLEALLSSPVVRPRLDAALDEAASLREAPEAAEALAEGLGRLRSELSRVEGISNRAAVEAREARATLEAGRDPSRGLAALDRVDAELGANGARDVVGFLLPPLREILGSRPASLSESLSQSEALYASVAASARYHLEVLPAEADL